MGLEEVMRAAREGPPSGHSSFRRKPESGRRQRNSGFRRNDGSKQTLLGKIAQIALEGECRKD